MGRRTAHLTVALFDPRCSGDYRLGRHQGTDAEGLYASTHPRLSVYVDKPPTKVQLYIGCFTSPAVVEYWDSAKLALKHDKFSFDGKTTISTENGATFGHFQGTVLFNGKFSGGKFRGTAQNRRFDVSKAQLHGEIREEWWRQRRLTPWAVDLDHGVGTGFAPRAPPTERRRPRRVRLVHPACPPRCPEDRPSQGCKGCSVTHAEGMNRLLRTAFLARGPTAGDTRC